MRVRFTLLAGAAAIALLAAQRLLSRIGLCARDTVRLDGLGYPADNDCGKKKVDSHYTYLGRAAARSSLALDQMSTTAAPVSRR